MGPKEKQFNTAIYALEQYGLGLFDLGHALSELNGGTIPPGCSYSNLSKAVTINWKDGNFLPKEKKTQPNRKLWTDALVHLNALLEHRFQCKYYPDEAAYRDDRGRVIPLIEIDEGAIEVSNGREGIIQIWPSVGGGLLDKKFGLARKEIRILSTYINQFTRLEQVLRQVLTQHRVLVKIMILHPVSESAALRQKGIRAGRNDINLETEIRSNIRHIERLKQDFPDQVEYRLINEQVGMQIYWWDDRMLRGNFYYAFESDLKPLEELAPTSMLYQAAEEHWNKLWDHYDEKHWADANCYTCYFLKSGDNGIEHFILQVNTQTNNIRILNTVSSDTFFGSFRILNDRYCSVTFSTDNAEHNATRMGYLQVYTGGRRLLNTDITLGGMLNTHQDDYIYGSMIVLRKMEAGVKTAEAPTAKIEAFFKQHEGLSFFQCKTADLDRLKSQLHDAPPYR